MASFLIKDVRVFDGESTIEKGFVLVENGKISKVSQSSIGYDGTTISKPGHTLLPGLIDTHIHADKGNTVALSQSLRFGVTTACDMHNEVYNIQKLRKQVEGGDCADIKTTACAATIDMGWPMYIVLASHDTPEVREEIATWWPKLDTPLSGRQYVQDRLRDRVDYIKLMHESGTILGQKINLPSKTLQKAIIDEAHKHGLMTVAHATCLADTVEILECGVDGLTHCFVDQPPTPELVAAYKKNAAHCNPTLATMGSATTEGRNMQERYAHDPRVQQLIGEEERVRMCNCMYVSATSYSIPATESCPYSDPSFAKDHGKAENAYEAVRQLKQAGVPILAGSDAAGPAVGTAWGLTMHQELAIFVQQCGFTPAEALRAATALPAERFNFDDRGQISQGRLADLVLVEGNPLEDIDHTLDLRAVWKAGVLCSAYKGQV